MILLDLDGVLADFPAASCVAHNRPIEEPTEWDYFKGWGLTLDEFWEPIHKMGPRFYGELVKPFPWAKGLVERIRNADDFVIVTTPSRSPWCYFGKRQWVNDHLGEDIGVEVVTQKELMSKPGHMLIDDSDSNVKRFEKCLMPGEAVLFPQPWNANSVFTPSRMEFIEVTLDDWKANLL